MLLGWDRCGDVPGHTKTRLMSVLSPQECVTFHRACLNDIVKNITVLGLPVFLYYAPAALEDDSLIDWQDNSWWELNDELFSNVSMYPQLGKDLGERMYQASRELLSKVEAVIFFLMIFQSVVAPLPAFVLTFANAGIFGWVNGAILSWTSAMAGAAVCYGIARLYGRGVVEKMTTRKALKEVDVFFERYGKWAVLIARLLPFISFDIVSYAAGLTALGFWEFFWATGLGQLPATLVYSYVGGMLVGSVRTMVFGLLMLFSCTALIYLGKQIWQDRSQVGEVEKEEEEQLN
jgi:uncharacterized membrane protein YdjX (TVP38/TMEM64 family)